MLGRGWFFGVLASEAGLWIFEMKSVVHRSPVMLTGLGEVGIIERKFCECRFVAMRKGGIVDS